MTDYEGITLYIDNRETRIYNSIKERDLDIYKEKVKIEVKQLELGDIHVILNNRCIIFERKSVADLLSSIKDGRYKEQKSRLLSNTLPCDITYIIEGDDINSSKNRNQNLLSGIYTHTLYRDNIHLIFTKDIEDTVSFILILISKMVDNPEKFEKEDKEYIDCVKAKSAKIKNITPDTCYLLQLSQIPTINITIAKNIQKVYPKFKNLIAELENTPTYNERISKLCKINKIGKEKATKIVEFLNYAD
jgi:ERCC4-type nuclease